MSPCLPQAIFDLVAWHGIKVTSTMHQIGLKWHCRSIRWALLSNEHQVLLVPHNVLLYLFSHSGSLPESYAESLKPNMYLSLCWIYGRGFSKLNIFIGNTCWLISPGKCSYRIQWKSIFLVAFTVIWCQNIESRTVMLFSAWSVIVFSFPKGQPGCMVINR